MSKNSSSSSSSGIGCFGLLQVALIVLKLTVRTDIEWWAVFIPTYVVVGVVVVVILVALIAAAGMKLFE